MSEKFIKVKVTMTRKVPISEMREYGWTEVLTDEELLLTEIDFAEDYVHEWMDNDDITFETEGQIIEGEDE
jgi:hypothetical protein